MIKVGQIFMTGDGITKYTITDVLPRRNSTDETICQAICNDGFLFENLKEEDILGDYLIAEYPTWQEAVNSKEFRDEYATK